MSQIKPSQFQYEVEDLIDFENRNGKQYALVLWKGFPKSQATWEPRSHLYFVKNYKHYYQEFKKKYQFNSKSSKIKRQNQHSRIISEGDNSPSSEKEEVKRSSKQIPQRQRLLLNQNKQIKKKKRNIPLSIKYKKPKIILKIEKIHLKKRGRKSKRSKLIDEIKLKLKESLNQNVVFPINKAIDEESKVVENQQNNVDEHENEQRKEKVMIQVHMDKAQDVQMELSELSSSESIEKEDSHQYQVQKAELDFKPEQFTINIKEKRQLPYINNNLKRIVRAFMRGNQIMFEVQFSDLKTQKPILISREYIKLIWPIQLIRYYQSKQKPSLLDMR